MAVFVIAFLTVSGQLKETNHANEDLMAYNENTELSIIQEHQESPYQIDLDERRRHLDSVNTGFVRPSVRSVTNGGKLTIKFDKEIEYPDNFIDQLNADKDSFIIL